MRKTFLLVAAAVAASLVATAVALATASAPTNARATTVKISTRKVAKLGVVLVNTKGRTLYMFIPTNKARSPASNGAPLSGRP